MTPRHPFHSICPYFAMFPESFVAAQLEEFTERDDLVFDPFCGRGTTIFESVRQGRRAAGSDVNSVAACVAGAKAAAPNLAEVLHRINELEDRYGSEKHPAEAPTAFFTQCYEPHTLSEILFLRKHLVWRHDPVDRFVAAVALGILHGESQKSPFALSNRMPRTISTKPAYSMRWWEGRDLTPPRRRVFECLRGSALFRFREAPAERPGIVRQGDARHAASLFPELAGQVRLVVTSPPYLDTTDFAEDQWLRLWFLGGEPRPRQRTNRDDRIRRKPDYWTFLRETWDGIVPLLAEEATIVVRIGGAKFTKEELFAGLTNGLRRASLGSVEALHEGVTSSAPKHTDALRSQPDGRRDEHDFVYRVSSACKASSLSVPLPAGESARVRMGEPILEPAGELPGGTRSGGELSPG